MGACSRTVAIITKNAVQSTAFLLRIAEDSKGKALSGADISLHSSQPRRNHERTKKYKESQKDSYIILFISRQLRHLFIEHKSDLFLFIGTISRIIFKHSLNVIYVFYYLINSDIRLHSHVNIVINTI